MKHKARFIYSLNNKQFYADVIIHYNKQYPRLTKYELIGYKTKFDVLEVVKETGRLTEATTRYCVDYEIGLKVKDLYLTGDCKAVYVGIDFRMYKLADQFKYQDEILSGFVMSKNLRTKLETSTVSMEYNTTRDFITATYDFAGSMAHLISERLASM